MQCGLVLTWNELLPLLPQRSAKALFKMKPALRNSVWLDWATKVSQDFAAAAPLNSCGTTDR